MLMLFDGCYSIQVLLFWPVSARAAAACRDRLRLCCKAVQSLSPAVGVNWHLLPRVAVPSAPSDGSLGSAAQHPKLNLVPWLQICTFNHSSWVDAMLIMWLFAPSGGV